MTLLGTGEGFQPLLGYGMLGTMEDVPVSAAQALRQGVQRRWHGVQTAFYVSFRGVLNTRTAP